MKTAEVVLERTKAGAVLLRRTSKDLLHLDHRTETALRDVKAIYPAPCQQFSGLPPKRSGFYMSQRGWGQGHLGRQKTRVLLKQEQGCGFM